jgi:hypothetical protein
MDDARAYTAQVLSAQARACQALGSPLYHYLLTRAAQDALAGGPVWEVFGHADGEPYHAADALRLMAAVHRLVLLGRAPRLARYYPSADGCADGGEGGGEAAAGGRGSQLSQLEDVWQAFRATLAVQPEAVREFVALPCQTNEVGRSAALLGGFLLVARETGLPLRLLEIGSSAGLQLRWDAFHYQIGGMSWGPPDSPVQMAGNWIVPPTDLDVAVEVVERRGCDPHPVDPTTAEGRITLTASLWADQRERLERLRGALEVAQRIPARVDEASAGEWLPERLAEPVPGVATVVFHSIVRQYVSPAEFAVVRAALDQAGARATPHTPLHWLYLEPETPDTLDRGTPFVVELTTWPGGVSRRLAISGAHGANIRWLS